MGHNKLLPKSTFLIVFLVRMDSWCMMVLDQSWDRPNNGYIKETKQLYTNIS